MLLEHQWSSRQMWETKEGHGGRLFPWLFGGVNKLVGNHRDLVAWSVMGL